MEARTKGKMRFKTFAVETVAVATVAASVNWKSLQKEIARHFSVTWRAARWDPGAFSAAFLLSSSFFLSSLILSDLLL